MSLAAFGLRLALVNALKGKTVAGASVLDAPLDPIDPALENERGVTIAVYTSDETASGDGADLLSADKSIDVVVQIYLPPTVTFGGVALDTRQSAAEPVLDLIWREICSVVLVDQSDWSALWRDLVFAYHETVSRPFLIETDRGIRLAAREVMIRVESISDPQFGPVESGSVWSRLLTLMRADPDIAPMADLLEAQIVGVGTLPVWQQAASALGLRAEAARAIGLDDFDAPSDVFATGENITFTDNPDGSENVNVEPTP